MVSPWPPRTKAVTFSTETSSSWAMNVRNRAESRTPAIPITRCLGKPDLFHASWAMASSGFVTTSASSRSTMYWAAVAPTFPAPTTVTFDLAMCASRSRRSEPLPITNVVNDGGGELRALDFLRSLHQAGEVVGHRLLADGRL